MVLLVVMGGIFVLTILVLSYNHLVQGKFNESREILKHLRAMKTAQAVSRYIVCKLRNDLALADNPPGSSGYLLRQAFRHNDPEKLEDAVNEWVIKENAADSFGRLNRELFGDYPMTGVSVSPRISFSDITPLSNLKKGNELFLDFEKAGIMNVAVEVFIGNTREIWQESRPFRVVVPFPMPITKFTLYLRAAADIADEMKFNTVSIDSPETGEISGQNYPLVLFNGMPGEHNNRRENIWEDRGWIHLGGGRISLNRAGGHRKYGQGFHSYFPEAQRPITLLFNFNRRSGGDFVGEDVRQQEGFISAFARWGFFRAFYDGPFSDVWNKVFAGEFKARPYNANPRYWNSSCLHLFGSNGQTGGENLISMTRVSGDVYDRFLDMCYLADASTKAPYGAVISHGKDTYESVLNSNTGADNSGVTSNLFVDQLVYLAVDAQKTFGTMDIRELEPFFLGLRYQEPGNVISYQKIMSKIVRGVQPRRKPRRHDCAIFH
jgi:hypothetical protein